MKTYDVTVTRSSRQWKTVRVTAEDEHDAEQQCNDLDDDGDWECDDDKDIEVVEATS